MSEIEASTTPRARVCVPNELVGIADPQERAVFSQHVVEAVMHEGKLKCARKAGSTTCRLTYCDITALASELEEVGYVSCDGGLRSCDDAVSEAALSITAGLEQR